jgi:hypothetical protein
VPRRQAEEGGLTLASFDVAKADQHPEIGEKMIRKLRAGLMPPKRAPQPDQASRMALVTALETTLDRAAAANPNPGHRVFQRLNRAEYAAAVKAIFGLDIDVNGYLPADTISASFDNIADVQTPSATVLQGYIRAAAHGQPRRGRRSVRGRDLDPVRGAADAVAEGSGRRGAVRHARRHRRHAQLPRRRQIQVPAAAARRAGRACSSAAPCATSRWKWRSTASAWR